VCRIRSSFYFVDTFFVAEHAYSGYIYYKNTPRYRKHTLANKPHISTEIKRPI
jgi:hypothetical protein